MFDNDHPCAYETYVAPLRSVLTNDGLNDEERRDLATVLRDVVIRFDNLWRMPRSLTPNAMRTPISENGFDALK